MLNQYKYPRKSIRSEHCYCSKGLHQIQLVNNYFTTCVHITKNCGFHTHYTTALTRVIEHTVQYYIPRTLLYFTTAWNHQYVRSKCHDVSLNVVLFEIEYLSHDGTASQSTTYNWTKESLGAHLAVTGGPTNDFNSVSCATTAINQYTAWWMLAFPGNNIYFTNVNIFYRSTSKYI